MIYIHFLIEDESGRILVEQIMKKYRRYADVDYVATKFRGIGGIPQDFDRMTNELKHEECGNFGFRYNPYFVPRPFPNLRR